MPEVQNLSSMRISNRIIPPSDGVRLPTVGFHNFKSQIFKLSVSNPKSKSVAYLSVLSQISNCQSLGRKNKHEILKTDRTMNLLGWLRQGWLRIALIIIKRMKSPENKLDYIST